MWLHACIMAYSTWISQLNCPLSRFFWYSFLVALNSRTEQPLELYIEEFETPYIAQIKAYYGQESNIKLSNCSISQYMKSAIERLTQEGVRNSRYCHATSHARVGTRDQLPTSCVLVRADELLTYGCSPITTILDYPRMRDSVHIKSQDQHPV